ncbi:MAG: outer membrane lipoprotein LolB [Lysobacterales bacterium CG17_big_fil_post_rev_8_21_14_2_50_64_11]|nr:MAG: outer membrane lipoprotein LolB [Xanthomonadales bacterium CG17_big_fil_post_rev_8_21_14_2_50_64_11]PIX60666.1 MAG: outer membrane lipoprotein LolB [Xanthomonadales bacterium CG_4_10_14_3_um_filter_64_11]
MASWRGGAAAARCERGLAIGLLSLLLAACVGAPPARPGDALTLAAQAQREAILAAQSHWQMRGRIALALGKDGGSGRLLWRQDGADYSIQVSAPVSRQSWRLSVANGWARLDGLHDGVREGPDAQALLRDSLGWDVPLVALSAWLRGMRARGPAQLQFDAQGLPAQIEQRGWLVQFRAWSTDAATPLPRRLFASRGDASVRLVIDSWQAAGADAAPPP